MTHSYRGILWDDLQEGASYWSTGRTVTEHDVAAFSALSGDFNPLHVDQEAGRRSEFGQRVPHGPLGILFAIGGYDRIGLLEGVVVALLEINWRFVEPVLIGDTVRTKVTVTELRETRKPDRGVATLHIDLYNQREQIVQAGEHIFLVHRRAKEST